MQPVPPSELASLSVRLRIWDLPTRLFHWLLALSVGGLLLSGQLGGHWLQWHFRFGYSALTLLLFRLVWGFVGSHWSRFATFVRAPRAVYAYATTRQLTLSSPGHNPLGGYSVLAMLGICLLQALTGLASDDDVLNAGPLARHLDSHWVQLATHFHTTLGKLTLIALVVLHLTAIAWYRHRGKNLVSAMLSGDGPAAAGSVPARDDRHSRRTALLLLAACAALVLTSVTLLA